MIRTIAFDADDTLWHNETHYREAEVRFQTMLAAYHDAAWIQERLVATEIGNLAHFGYGIKSFILSMIETAVELTEGRITGTDVQRIVDLGKEMLSHPVESLPGVEPVLTALQGRYQLLVITKGDLLDQESKLARSGLGAYFSGLDVVSEKDEGTYRAILDRRGVAVSEFLMVGNSVKSDILPVVALGAQAVHIPAATTWVHEHVPDVDTSRFATLARMDLLPDWLKGR